MPFPLPPSSSPSPPPCSPSTRPAYVLRLTPPPSPPLNPRPPCRHESDLKDNAYVLGLITHLQNPNVPLKNAECLRDLVAMYELLTIEDIITAYNQLGLGDDAVGGPVWGGEGEGSWKVVCCCSCLSPCLCACAHSLCLTLAHGSGMHVPPTGGRCCYPWVHPCHPC